MQKPQVRLASVVYIGKASDQEIGGKPWPHFAWTVTLECAGRKLVTPWKAGIGHVTPKGKPVPPKAAEVLASLIMDGMSGAETFENFCADMGMDTDSRRALETYLACQKAGADVRKLLGMDPAALVYERDAEQVAADLCAVES